MKLKWVVAVYAVCLCLCANLRKKDYISSNSKAVANSNAQLGSVANTLINSLSQANNVRFMQWERGPQSYGLYYYGFY
jgi:hypothetical protein